MNTFSIGAFTLVLSEIPRRGWPFRLTGSPCAPRLKPIRKGKGGPFQGSDVHMNCLLTILVIATPFWVSDVVIGSLGLGLPYWIGDTLALLAAVGGALLLRRFFHGRQAESVRSKPLLREAGIAQSGFPGKLTGDWERSLPCLVHEIRNYSSTLRGNAILLRRSLPPESSFEPLSRLERTTDKIDHLARKILDAASQPGFFQTQSIDVRVLIRDCIRDHFSDSGIFIALEDGGDSRMEIEGDPLQLEIVFINLFRNALEAGACKVGVSLGFSRSLLSIRIEDDGGGCCKEVLARLFQPLFTTKKVQGGTGLGLYLARSILESHGGSIRAETKYACGRKEIGMIFSLELPLKKKTGWDASVSRFANGPFLESSRSFSKKSKKTSLSEWPNPV